jgi:hypothetical protein
MLAVFDEALFGQIDSRAAHVVLSPSGRLGSAEQVRLRLDETNLTLDTELGDEVVLHYHDLRERNVDLLFGRVVELEDRGSETTEHAAL